MARAKAHSRRNPPQRVGKSEILGRISGEGVGSVGEMTGKTFDLPATEDSQ
jgi:hypothetical protein